MTTDLLIKKRFLPEEKRGRGKRREKKRGKMKEDHI